MFGAHVFRREPVDGTGLVVVGGDLRPRHLLEAYGAGVFPWYEEGGPVCWWSPDPRAIFELSDFRVSRRLGRTIRSNKFRSSVNQDFAGVIRGCADRPEGTWITSDMIRAYETLHRQRVAHSIEVWHQDSLAGGVYGVAIGGFFAGESMFTRVRDASKVALAYLVARLKERGFRLFDIQMLTEHTARLGATEISRASYLARLAEALAV